MRGLRSRKSTWRCQQASLMLVVLEWVVSSLIMMIKRSDYEYSIMKKSCLYLIAASVVVASCNDTMEISPVVEKAEGTYVTIEQPDVVSTKGLNYNDGKISFVWESGEQLMVYGSTSSAAIFTINEGGSSVAKLESPDFKLNEGKEYYVYSPVSGTLSSANKKAVNVSFSGQRQIANTDTKHLSLNQYACAVGTVENNIINFQLYNQVAWIRYSHTFAEGVTGAKTVTVSVSEGEPFIVSGTLDATAPVSEKGFTTSITATKSASSITLELGEESGNGIDIAAGDALNAFFTVHPVDLTGKTITFTVKDSEGKVLVSNDYYGEAIIRNGVKIFVDESVKPSEVATVDGVAYATIKDAIDNVAEGGTITLLANVQDEAIFVAKGDKNFTIDLDGHTFTATDPLAGSTGTQNQALHLEAGNTITIKNGTIKAIDGAESIKFIIQNYADLTLEDVTIDAGNLNYPGQVCYALSNNCGNVLLTGNTSIINVPEGAIAMDACKFSSYEKPTVTVSTSGTIEGTIELSGGDLVLGADLKVTKPIIGMYKGVSDINLAKHTITAPEIAVLNENATLTIHNGNIVSENNVGVMVGDNSNTTLTSCNVTGLEGAVATGLATGATITITNGKYTATDNAVIAGNGSKREGNPNTIIINSGKFIGQIKTSGYIACGIYAPWKDIITVNGGTFTITNGVGVLCRGGNVTINNGTFVTTGTQSGWVGDNKNLIECKTVVLDKIAKYPDYENATIIVKKGTFSDDSFGAYLEEGYAPKLTSNGFIPALADEALIQNGLNIDKEVTVNDIAIVKTVTCNTNSSLHLKGSIQGNGENNDVLQVGTGSDLTIDGTGSIVAPTLPNNTSTAINVLNGGVVNIKGNISVYGGSGSKGNYAIKIVKGTANIYDGYYHSGKDVNGKSGEVIYLASAYSSSSHAYLNIYGGVFECDGDAAYLINCYDSYHSKCHIKIMGGIFVGFNPADSAADKIDGKNANWVPDGYVSKEITYNGKQAWEVTKAE